MGRILELKIDVMDQAVEEEEDAVQAGKDGAAAILNYIFHAEAQS